MQTSPSSQNRYLISERFFLLYSETVSQTIHEQYLGQAEGDAARNNRGMGSQRENVLVVGRSLHNDMSRRENNQYFIPIFSTAPSAAIIQRKKTVSGPIKAKTKA